MYFLSFRIFEQLALALKNRVPLEFFNLLKILFTFKIFEQLALALKNKVSLEFFTALNMYFLSFRIFEQLALALKTESALKFFKPGRAADPLPRTPMNATSDFTKGWLEKSPPSSYKAQAVWKNMYMIRYSLRKWQNGRVCIERNYRLQNWLNINIWNILGSYRLG